MKPISKPWTEHDNERLKKLLDDGASLIRIAAAFNRKTASIKTQAKKLGLRFPTMRDSKQNARAALYDPQRT